MFGLHFCVRNQLLEFDRGDLNAFLADEMTHSARRIITLIVDAIIHCVDLHPWTEVVYHNLESKKALFYIFDSTGSVFENSAKPLF